MCNQYQNNIPFFAEGIEADRICFSGGRTAVDIARHGGITSVKYFGRQYINDEPMFASDTISAWQQLFRLFINIDDRMYYAEFSNTLIHPYGYESSCTFEGITFKHSLTLLNDAIVFEVTVEGNPGNKQIGYTLATTENCVRISKPYRSWVPFKIDNATNSVTAKAIDDRRDMVDSRPKYLTQTNSFGFEKSKYSETLVSITSSQEMTTRIAPSGLNKTYCRINGKNGYGNFVILFGYNDELHQQRLQDIQSNAMAEVQAVKAEYARNQEEQTAITCQNKVVQSLLNNARNILNSMKIKDIPGGMRAADSGYWIWGWDSMVFSNADMMTGDHEFVKDMLHFYRKNSHPKFGIFHSMNLAGNPEMAMAPAAQTLYCIMLYNYFTFSRNEEVLKEYYPFTCELIARAMEDQVGDYGLLKGVALYPDFPEYLDQNGNDISSFNNSITYQALRCMQHLAKEMDDATSESMFKEFADKMKVSFNKYLFDEEKGFYYDSISAADLSPRKHYPNYAILRVTGFADELTEGRDEIIAQFMDSNHTARIGLRMLPRWDSSHMKDGNQLGIYMPVTEAFYRHTMRKCGFKDTLLSVLEENWSQISIMEALTTEAINHGITLDNPGRKQAFSLRAWYSLFFSYYLGIDFNFDKLVINAPIAAEPATVRNLKIGTKTVNIEYQVTDCRTLEIYLNGKLQNTNSFPYNQLPEDSHLTINIPK